MGILRVITSMQIHSTSYQGQEESNYCVYSSMQPELQTMLQNETQKFISLIWNKIIHQLNKFRNGFNFKIEVKLTSHVLSRN